MTAVRWLFAAGSKWEHFEALPGISKREFLEDWMRRRHDAPHFFRGKVAPEHGKALNPAFAPRAPPEGRRRWGRRKPNKIRRFCQLPHVPHVPPLKFVMGEDSRRTVRKHIPLPRGGSDLGALVVDRASATTCRAKALIARSPAFSHSENSPGVSMGQLRRVFTRNALKWLQKRTPVVSTTLPLKCRKSLKNQ